MSIYFVLIMLYTISTSVKSLRNINSIKFFKNIKTKNLKLKNSINNYNDELNLLQNYKYYFQKENYNDIMKNVLDNKVSRIFIDSNYKELVSVDNLPDNLPNDDIYSHYHLADINPIVIPNLISKTTETHIPIYFVNFTSENIIGIQNFIFNLFGVMSNLFPFFLLFLFLSSLRNMNSIGAQTQIKPLKNRPSTNTSSVSNNPFGFFPNFQKEEDIEEFVKPNVSLSSWAGSPEVIEECKEVISYIESKEKFQIIGAEMPKGILLEGPPGTGKTMLAKAIATETNSTFISTSGSEFVEMFVGMGAARVRDLFETARENIPCIIFIDEIDAVGRQRGSGANMINDEREQTLNQLLYEMDGFNNNEDILVMAATNRKDILDKALIRPGRFDRIIKIPLPDKSSREKILAHYLRTKNVMKTMDITAIAELTEGFSGAQLKNLINEAAIISVRNNFTVIQEQFIFDAFEKSIVGLIKSNANVSPTTKLRVAIHESGHSLLALKFSEYFYFQKASIQPTYNGAGGYTIFSENPDIKEGGLYTKDILKKRLIIYMGGKAAEEIYYGNEFVSLGAYQDLRQSNNLAQKMVGNFGMGEKLEVFFSEDISDDAAARGFALGERYSQETKTIIDREALDLVKESYIYAKDFLEKNKDKLIEFTELLLNNTVIYRRDLENNHNFTLY